MNCVCQYTQTCYQDTYSLNIFNSNLSSSTAIYTLSLHDALPISPMREDTSFATFYLISLGLGVLLVSVRGSNVDLMQDRKSTRLNSSHVAISYAVFCLKKKIQRNIGVDLL